MGRICGLLTRLDESLEKILPIDLIEKYPSAGHLGDDMVDGSRVRTPSLRGMGTTATPAKKGKLRES